MKKPFPILLALLAAAATNLSAQPAGFQAAADPESVAKLLTGQAAEIRTIQSSFVQKKQLQYLDETITSKGSFWFKRDNSLRWEYLEPFHYTIVLHEGIFRIIDGDQVSEFDVASNPVFGEINDMIIGMVQGDILKEDRFGMQYFENQDTFLAILEPLASDVKEVIAQMEITFDKTDLMVSEITMREGELDYTVISFLDRRINETVPDSVFRIGR